MTKDDKQKLLMYLSMALPYNLMGDRLGVVHKIISVNVLDRTVTLSNGDYMPNTYYLDAAELPVKPYIRQMSSMTEEEKNRFYSFMEKDSYGFPTDAVNKEKIYEYINWLLANKFDFMDLIPNGLAIAITEQNNIYKN